MVRLLELGAQIVGEWAIYRCERMVNLKITSYVASKFTVLGLLCLIQCLAPLTIVYWGCRLKGPWLTMFGVLVLASLTGLALGLLIRRCPARRRWRLHWFLSFCCPWSS